MTDMILSLSHVQRQNIANTFIAQPLPSFNRWSIFAELVSVFLVGSTFQYSAAIRTIMLTIRTRKTSLAIILLFITVACLALTSCSKKKESKSLTSSTILSLPLMKVLPDNTVGFFAWNYDSPHYSNFTKTYSALTEMNNKSLLDEMEGLLKDSQELGVISQLLQWMLEEKFIESDLKKPQPLRNGIAFLDVPRESLPGAGLYITANNSFNLVEKLDGLKKKLEQEGLTTKPLPADQTDDELPRSGYVVEVDGKDNKKIPLYVRMNRSVAAFSSSLPLTALPFQKIDTTNEYSTVLNSKNFTTLKQEAKLTGDELTLAYLNIEEVVSKLEGIVKTFGGTEDIDATQVPLNTLLFSGDMIGSAFWTNAFLKLNDTAGQYLKYTEILNKPNSVMLPQVDDQSVLSFGLTQNVLQAAKQGILANGEQKNINQIKPILDLIDNVQSIRIGVTKNDPSSLFPGIFIDLATPDAATLESNVKALIKTIVESGQAPLTPWQEKDLDGTKVSYSLSPLGIGLFIGKTEKGLTLASSESAIKGMLNKKDGDSLSSTFGDASKNTLESDKPMIFTHVSGKKLAELIGTAQGNLAMFTGGKNAVDKEQIKQIQNIGNILWSLSYKDNTVTFRGIQKPEAQS